MKKHQRPREESLFRSAARHEQIFARRARESAMSQVDCALAHSSPLLSNGLPNPEFVYLTRRKACGWEVLTGGETSLVPVAPHSA